MFLCLQHVSLPPETSIREPDIANGRSEGERQAARIAALGRMAWQEENGYGERSIVEMAIFNLIGGVGRLTVRTFGTQDREIAFRISAANKAVRHAKPVIVRIG